MNGLACFYDLLAHSVFSDQREPGQSHSTDETNENSQIINQLCFNMHPVYFTTRFRTTEPNINWPDAFAIITAFQTTGEEWPEAQNQEADARLLAVIHETGRWHRRLTGFSPDTGHAEPGWAVEISFDEACLIGEKFLQDAIFFVECDTLFVSHCMAEHRMKIYVGSFIERIYTTFPPA